MRKWLSYTIDIVLILIIGVLGYVQISMLVTRDRNFGVPSAFGHSFLYVLTDSMDDEPNHSIWKGCGIIIEKVDPKDLRPSTPIYDERGNVIDYEKDGDVVTFFLDSYGKPDTHRLVSKNYDAESATYVLETMGDRPDIHAVMGKERWTEDKLIGRVVHHSEALGNLLVIASPEAAASKGQTAWLLPVTLISMIGIIGGITAFDIIKSGRVKRKEEEKEMERLLVEAGIDPNDEAAVEAFKAKEEFKREYKERFEEEKEKAKEEARRIYEEEKRKVLKEMEKERRKGE